MVPRAGVGAWLTDHVDEDGDALIFGSGTLWNGLLARGLVDELHLMIGSVVLGDGAPTFAGP